MLSSGSEVPQVSLCFSVGNSAKGSELFLWCFRRLWQDITKWLLNTPLVFMAFEALAGLVHPPEMQSAFVL